MHDLLLHSKNLIKVIIKGKYSLLNIQYQNFYKNIFIIELKL